MLKNLLDRLFQLVILIVATYLAIHYTPELKKHITDPTYQDYLDVKFVVPIATAIIYSLLLFLTGVLLNIPFLRRRLDDKYKFCGTYVSFPENADELGIFKIYAGFLKRKYRLEGVTYSIATRASTGSWSSDFLDMSPKSPARLTYIYTGNSNRVPSGGTRRFAGHGYSKIEFTSPDFERGSGYFVDDSEDLDRKHSNYRRNTREFRKEIGRRWWNCGRTATIRAFANLSDNERAHYRPAPTKLIAPPPPTTSPLVP